MDSQVFRHTESIKLEKDEITLFKKCAKLFKYDVDLASAIGVSRQKLYTFKKDHKGNLDTLKKVRGFISEYKEQIAA